MPHEQSSFELCFIGMGTQNHRHAAPVFSRPSAALHRRKGRDMKIPKTPIEFDYDLWTTEDGRCMVRIKASGEKCEISRETMRLLRAEEKRLRRSYTAAPSMISGEESAGETILSLDVMYTESVRVSAWLADPTDIAEAVTTKIFIEEFCSKLTPVQADFFRECLLEGKAYHVFAGERKFDRTTLWRWKKMIEDKVKKEF